jgi:lysophospholipase L1-like esterase
MLRIRNALKNSCLVLAGFAVALALMEAALRVYNPFEIRFKPDRIVLPVNKKYLIDNTAKFTKLDRITVHTKNSLGFRGAPPPVNFTDYLTIITMGGSTTECFYLSDGNTWTDVLGRKLARDFNRVWINNAGLDGATTYRHLILLEDYLVALKPKLALFLVGINDVGAGNLQAADRRKSPSFKSLNRWILNHSEVYSLGQNLYRYCVAQERGLHHQEIDLKAQGTLDRIHEKIQAETLRQYQNQSLPYYRQRLAQLIKICRDHGIEPVFLTQPVLYGRGTDPATGVNLETVRLGENLNGRLMYEIVELYNQALRQTGEQEHVRVIDLAKKMPRDSAYYYDYLHYTDRGAQQVAEIVYQDLRPFAVQRYEGFIRAGAEQ